MIRLDGGAMRRTLALIERYGLHDERAALPVPIRQLAKDEGWVVQYRGGMGKALAMAFIVGPIRLMYVNENHSVATQRMAMAHEMGHVLAGHQLGLDIAVGRDLRLASVSEQQEVEAQLIAALLLIPHCLQDAPVSINEIALMCQVPLSLAEMFRLAAPVGASVIEAVA